MKHWLEYTVIASAIVYAAQNPLGAGLIAAGVGVVLGVSWVGKKL